jgi:hypothetical protein
MPARDQGAPRPARLVHSIAGRVRFKVHAARDDEPFFEAARRALLPVAGVHSVRVSAPAASVVVQYAADDDSMPQRLMEVLGSAGLADFDAGTKPSHGTWTSGLEARELPEDSHLAELIVAGAQLASQLVRTGSGGAVDLKVLVALAAALSSATTSREPQRGTPLWVTLAVFAFNAFVSLHGNRITGAAAMAPARRPALPSA